MLPKPVLTLLDLSLPIAFPELGEAALENKLMLNNMDLSQASNKGAAQDGCILRLTASCCNGDKLVRATELAKLLSVKKSVKGAIQLATALKLPSLEERFNSVVEERLHNKTEKPLDTSLATSKYNLSDKADVAASKNLTASGRSEIAGTAIPSSSVKLSAPSFTMKAKPSNGVKVGKQKSDQYQTATMEDSKEAKN
ncbi:hypothetical protein SLEP1_g8491 [Rubroshorea leprosula]|uniref:WDHD1/CFT4 helical bundle domain-containing protein n=1 Tax=Rubroshorea leprosula TaxID=152421 RepID=A0AAV5I1X2_9ROSI|nr:hypothetical protein SLEP1_g8491 [Rubroshorea leprosula]